MIPTPSARNDFLRLFVMFSGSASTIQYLERYDPHWNHRYRIVGALTDRGDVESISFFKKENIPCYSVDLSTFPLPNVFAKREFEYFGHVRDMIDENAFDYVIFSEFSPTAPNWFIRYFERKIIDVHPADLSINSNGRQEYVGGKDSAIQKMLGNGLTITRSTAYFVGKDDADEIELVAHSRPCKISPHDTAEKLRDRLKLIADGEALKNALQILYSKHSQGSVA